MTSLHASAIDFLEESTGVLRIARSDNTRMQVGRPLLDRQVIGGDFVHVVPPPLSTYCTSAIQLRARRVKRGPTPSPSNEACARRRSDESTLLKALTLTTAYSLSSIKLVATGTMPHRLQTWNTAVR